MKKTVVTLFLALLCAGLYAQEYNINLGASIGVYDRYTFGHSEIIDMHESSTYNDEITYTSNPNVLPTICLETGYVFPGNHIGAFLGTYWSYAWNYLHGGPSLMIEREHVIHIVPQIRFYYLFRDDMRMYATLGAGVRYRQFAESFEGDTIRAGHTSFSYILSPFGMSFGGRWTVSCDVGHGTPWSVLNITAGYRF